MPMATLVVTSRPITSLSHGYDLRVYSLCKTLDEEMHLVAVPLGDHGAFEHNIDASSVFESVRVLEPLERKSPRWRRLLRLSEADFLRLAYPDWFSRVSAQLRHVAGATGCRRAIVFGSELAGLATQLGMNAVLYDVCDSIALTYRRELAARAGRLGWRRHAAERLRVWRWQRAEAAIVRGSSRVTAINEADARELRRLSRAEPSRVQVVPNGVGEMFLREHDATAATRRGVAFWGNLAFAPNRDAMSFFIEAIYLPFLQRHGVEVCIIGKDAQPWLRDLAARDPQIKLLGYVADLPQAATAYPVMVNPMRIGSGMKNKVLEAFGAGLAVVSTRLGIEALPESVAGVHYLQAEEASAFADAVLELLNDAARRKQLSANARQLVVSRYRWEAVGKRWNDLVAQV
jgi:glycosyltransferase involved in cell wall biosynthesis